MPNSTKEELHLRLVVVIPVLFLLVSLGIGLVVATQTQSLVGQQPSSSELLLLRLSIVGYSLLAALLGALLSYAIIKPLRRAIREAKRMIQYSETEPRSIKAANEVRALSTLFDQAVVSFVELVQAREMLDNVHEGVVALDLEGKIAGMNLSAQEILGISLPEARHKDLRDLLGGAAKNSILIDIAQRALKERQERVHTRVPCLALSGRDYLLFVKVSPLRLRREGQKFIGIVMAFKEYAGGHEYLPKIIGRSEAFTEVLDLATKVAPTDSTVLLTGESGTGKEIIADAVHRLSRRKERPFIKLNCAAIPEGLLESELFGHEKGAFTGAVNKRAGKFELADGGTIFLDEIGDMSPSTQAKLLRVLQGKEFTPLGGGKAKRVDVRIIAATNRDLVQEVREGRFREDLFYRLNVITIGIPPLRERKADIPLLADYFLEEAARRNNAPKKPLSRAALDCLLSYPWPGNVRELENAIERAALLSNDATLFPEDLPITAQSREAAGLAPLENPQEPQAKASLNETLEAVEKEIIVQALKKTSGVQIEAAKILGLKHKNLWHKIRKHKINVGGLKNQA